MAAARELVLEARGVRPTGVERTFGREEVIVSKTDLVGNITYANEVFCRVAGYHRNELVGANHNLIRHPDMPRCVFKLLWDTIADGREIFAYVKNLARDGAHYWVLAHVTPTFDARGQIVGYHSNRRCPDRKPVEFFDGLYRQLKQVEDQHADRREGLTASFAATLSTLNQLGISYDELVFAQTPQ